MNVPAQTVSLASTDALIVVDVQNDFLPAGALAVPNGDMVVPILNRYIELFKAQLLPVVLTRDWHPANHCSFHAQGGPWPNHCVAETPGAAFAPSLAIPFDAWVVSKAMTPNQDAYSAFQGTELAARLHRHGCLRLFIGGLATDYCVLETVKDALKEQFQVFLLEDAIRAVDVQPGDGATAIQMMRAAGAIVVKYADLSGASHET